MNRQQRIARHLKKTFTIREAKTTGNLKEMEKKQTMWGEDKKTNNLYTHINHMIEKINCIHETRKAFSEKE